MNVKHVIEYIDGTTQAVNGKLVIYTDTPPLLPNNVSEPTTIINMRLVRSITTTPNSAKEVK